MGDDILKHPHQTLCGRKIYTMRGLKAFIARRQRQILVNSVIYYKYNNNIISDDTWSRWALELEHLQAKYPDIARSLTYGKAFIGFDHSTGQNLPLEDEWANDIALRLIKYVEGIDPDTDITDYDMDIPDSVPREVGEQYNAIYKSFYTSLCTDR